MAKSKLKQKDYLWWALAATLGLTAMWLPSLLKLDPKLSSTPSTTVLIAHIGLLIFTAVIGYLKPERPWRWGIASVLLFPVNEIAVIATVSKLSLIESIPYLVVKIPVYAIQSIPAFIGAYLGAFAKKGIQQFRPEGNLCFWVLGFILGLLAAGIPLLATDNETPLLLWAIGVFLSAFIISIARSKGVWRWGLAVLLALPPVIFTQAAIHERTIHTHNLWPLEIIIALIFAAPSAFGGAYFGLLIKLASGKFINRGD